ncbi:MAG: MJ0042-type zinc finger domain-containing protein [Rhodospirillales bacterium]
MYLFCPSCSTSFSIDGISIGMEGRSVRCFNCGHTWRQFPAVSKKSESQSILGDNQVQSYTQLLPGTQPQQMALYPRRPQQMAPIQQPQQMAPIQQPQQMASIPQPQQMAPIQQPQQMASIPQPQQMAPEDNLITQELPSDKEIKEMLGDDEPPVVGNLLEEVEQHETNLEDLEALEEPEPLKVLFDEAPNDEEQNIDPETIPDPEPTDRVVYEDDVEKPKSSLLKKIIIISIVLFVLIGLFVGAILARHTLVHLIPSFNSVFSLVGFRVDIPGDGLKIVSKKPSREKRDGKDVTIINGRIVNVSGSERKVPEIVIRAIDGNGKIVKTQIVKPSKLILGTGKAVNFKALIVAMPKSAKRLDITYGSFISSEINKK